MHYIFSARFFIIGPVGHPDNEELPSDGQLPEWNDIVRYRSMTSPLSTRFIIYDPELKDNKYLSDDDKRRISEYRDINLIPDTFGPNVDLDHFDGITVFISYLGFPYPQQLANYLNVSYSDGRFYFFTMGCCAPRIDLMFISRYIVYKDPDVGLLTFLPRNCNTYFNIKQDRQLPREREYFMIEITKAIDLYLTNTSDFVSELLEKFPGIYNSLQPTNNIRSRFILSVNEKTDLGIDWSIDARQLFMI